MYNQCLTDQDVKATEYIATTFDDWTKKTKTRGDNKPEYYQYLTRPDGKPLSEQDCLFLNRLINWTKGNKEASTTYWWLLKNKYPHKRHPRTINRMFKNVSNYITGKFKNNQIINGVEERDKIKVERVADFDYKMIEAIQKSIEENKPNNSTKCRPSLTKMSTMDDENVNPSTYIYNKTINKTTDNQDNQFQNIKKLNYTEDIETNEAKIVTTEIVKTSENRLAKEESVGITQAKKQNIEFVESANSLVGKQNITSYYQSLEVVGKDGKKYKATPLMYYRLNDAIFREAIALSQKKDYEPGRVRVIIRNILEKKPNTAIYGGRQGFINYLVKAINGENDYDYNYQQTEEEQALSMAEIANAKRIQLEKELVKNEIQWF